MIRRGSVHQLVVATVRILYWIRLSIFGLLIEPSAALMCLFAVIIWNVQISVVNAREKIAIPLRTNECTMIVYVDNIRSDPKGAEPQIENRI